MGPKIVPAYGANHRIGGSNVQAEIYPSSGCSALLAAVSGWSVKAQDDRDDRDSREIKHVFVIALENHNWTQPAAVSGGIQQIYQNPNAPFINSLVNGTALVYVDGHLVNISEQVSYATAYHNVLATPSGNNPHIHPSEPNYLWAEAGTNFGVLNDNDPFVVPGGTSSPPARSTDRAAASARKNLEGIPGRHRPSDQRRQTTD